MTEMTDGRVVDIARRMDRLLGEVNDLYTEIQESDHPNAEDICAALDDNLIWTAAWATHCVAHALEHPERWETGDWGIRRKRKQ